MKGNQKLIDMLNYLLADELTAINQYMVHSEMCANWGYQKLHEGFEKRAIDEMKHAEQLIGRILFLEGTPVVTSLNKSISVRMFRSRLQMILLQKPVQLKLIMMQLNLHQKLATMRLKKYLIISSWMKMHTWTSLKSLWIRLAIWVFRFSLLHR